MYRNSEGYPDPTAGKAISSLKHIPEKVWEVIKIGRDFFRLAGLDVLEITVEDRRSKERFVWKKRE